MIAPEKLNTYQKALSLNLDSKIFAPFAEIGAEQEVARWLLRVGRGELCTHYVLGSLEGQLVN
jgi:hypothetical protein